MFVFCGFPDLLFRVVSVPVSILFYLKNLTSVFPGESDENVFEVHFLSFQVGVGDAPASKVMFYVSSILETVQFATPADEAGVVDLFVCGQCGRLAFGIEAVAQEAVHEFAYRFLQEDAPVVENDTVVDEFLHILNDVGGKKDRFMFVFGVVAEVVDEEAPIPGIETQGEVVENEQVGILSHNQSECYLRALSARHVRDALPGCYLQQLHQVVVGVFVPSGVERGVETLYLLDVHKGILHMSFDKQSDAAFCPGADVADVFSEECATSTLWLEVAVQQVDGSGFSRSVLAEQAQYPSFGNGEGEVLVDQAFAVVVRQVFAGDDGLHKA